MKICYCEVGQSEVTHDAVTRVIAESMLDDSWVIVDSLEDQAEAPTAGLEMRAEGEEEEKETSSDWTGQGWSKYV